MSHTPIEPEVLAAFLDGQLTDAARDAVLRQLASDPAARASLLEASAIMGALAGSDALPRMAAAASAPPAASLPSPSPLPLPSPSVARGATSRPPAARRFAPVLLIAASVAIVVLLRSTRSAGSVDVVQLAQAVRVQAAPGRDLLQRSLGSTWNESGWSVSRGGEEARAAGVRAFRIGVRTAQLELAIQHGDSAATAVSAAAVEGLLADIDGAAPVAAQFGRLARGTVIGSASERRTLATQVQGIVGDAARFDLGVWAESARLATLGGDMTWFSAGGAPQRALSRLLTRPSPDEGWHQLIAPLFPLLGDDVSRRDPASVRAMLTGVIRAGGL